MIKIKLTASNADYELAKIKAMAQDTDLTVEVRQYKKTRSLNQNALYWIWLKKISESLIPHDGKCDPDIWHEYFKLQFCPVKVVRIPQGNPINKRSTSILDKGEMQYYMNLIYQWSVNSGLLLPVPENSEYMRLESKQNE